MIVLSQQCQWNKQYSSTTADFVMTTQAPKKTFKVQRKERHVRNIIKIKQYKNLCWRVREKFGSKDGKKWRLPQILTETMFRSKEKTPPFHFIACLLLASSMLNFRTPLVCASDWRMCVTLPPSGLLGSKSFCQGKIEKCIVSKVIKVWPDRSAPTPVSLL